MSFPLRRRNIKGRDETIRKNVLYSIPDHLLYSIINRVSRRGFEKLGPLLRTGKLGRDLVYKDEVLKEACLQTFLNEPYLVNDDRVGDPSVYRPFFVRCVKAGNVVACYLESLRLAVREGKIEEGIELLLKTSHLSEQMEFTLGIFLITRGHYHNGIERLASFKNRVGCHARAQFLSGVVLAHMRQIFPVPLANPPYSKTWRFDDVPVCVGGENGCTHYTPCEGCFDWLRSIQFIRLF